MNPQYSNHIAGRLEIMTDDNPYSVDEYRVFTDKIIDFCLFIEKIDMKNIGIKRLKEIKHKIESEYNIFSEKYAAKYTNNTHNSQQITVLCCITHQNTCVGGVGCVALHDISHK